MLGEDQHGRAGRLPHDAPQKFQPRKARQIEIEDDEGKWPAAHNFLQRGLAGRGFKHLDIATLVEKAANAGADDGVILDHQHLFHATIRSCARGNMPDTRTPPPD